MNTNIHQYVLMNTHVLINGEHRVSHGRNLPGLQQGELEARGQGQERDIPYTFFNNFLCWLV